LQFFAKEIYIKGSFLYVIPVGNVRVKKKKKKKKKGTEKKKKKSKNLK